jgi:hypothetical protein
MKFFMRRFTYFTIPFVFIFLASFKPVDLPKTFTDLLSRANMMFEAPNALVSTPIIYNRAMSYEYALKYTDKNFEIRYAVRPSDNLWKEYELAEKSKKKSDVNINPDSTYLSAFQTVIANASNGEFPKVTEFDKAAVKVEFNADWGGTVIIHPRKEFGQDYKFCMIVAIHKSHAGEAYIFYLSDKQDGFNDLVAPAFHSLLFNRL